MEGKRANKDAPKNVGMINCPCLGRKENTTETPDEKGTIRWLTEEYTCGARCFISWLPNGDFHYQWDCDKCREE